MLPDREARLAGIRARMDQAVTARQDAEREICRLTAELIGIGAEVRAEMACKNQLNEGSRT